MTTHIKFDERTAWCGSALDTGFHFASVEAAVMNGKHDKHPRACGECTDVIIGFLIEGSEHDAQPSDK